MKRLLLLSFTLITFTTLSAQDYIKLKTDEAFIGTIKEVTPTEIRYRSFLIDDTILYSIDKKYVSFVKYKRKIKEVINAEEMNPKKVVIPYKHKYPITSIDGGDYLIEGRRGDFKKLRAALLDLKNPELTKLVKKFTAEKRIGNIILYSTPAVGAASLVILFANHAVGFGAKDPALDHLVFGLAGVEAALLSSSFYLNIKKKKHVREAIAMYNKLVH